MFKCEATGAQIDANQRQYSLITTVRRVSYVYGHQDIRMGFEPVKVQKVCKEYFDQHEGEEPVVVGNVKVVDCKQEKSRKFEDYSFIGKKIPKRLKKKQKSQKEYRRKDYDDDDEEY